ncbi:MAG TPA: hypothetical protein VMC42_06695 [Methanoregulaceae archaeon]|nr:hypothetical protein [Methanoregulaceae archaeon]
MEEKIKNDEKRTAPEYTTEEVISYGEWQSRRQIPGDHPYRRRH